MNRSKRQDLLFLVFFVVLSLTIILLSRNIPFFWDNYIISRLATFYYENSFSKIVPPLNIDYGVFTFYAYYIAAFWKIFGKTLLVSHLAMLPILTGIFWELRKISLHFIRPGYFLLFLLFILADPAFITQAILMGYDLFLLYFFLAALRSLINRKYLLYSLCLVIMAGISVRGILGIFSLFFVHILYKKMIEKKKLKFKLLLLYLPCTIFLITWMLFHYAQTGWFFFTPEENYFRDFNGLLMAFRHFFYIIWKITDSGRLFIWVFFLICFLTYIKTRKTNPQFKLLAIFLFVPLLVNIIFMVPISNPVGHKYFLLQYVFLSLFAVLIIQEFQSIKTKILFSTLIVAFFIAGNFIVYPQKYGNAWETSLKTLPYFTAEKEMKEFLSTQNINPSEIYTFFPLNNNHKFSYLNEDYAYKAADTVPTDSCRYVILSTIFNIKNPGQFINKTRNWVVLKNIRYWPIEIKLLENPTSYKH